MRFSILSMLVCILLTAYLSECSSRDLVETVRAPYGHL